MYSLNSKQLSFRWLSADKNCNQPYGRLVFEVSKAPFYSTTTATPTDSYTAPALPIYIRKRRRLHSTCSYSQARATVESVFSWDRCFRNGASGNVVHRNCDRAGDSSCCITTKWALPNRKHLHIQWLVSVFANKANQLVTTNLFSSSCPTLLWERPQ